MGQLQNGFQTSVNNALPVGPAGAFASANPRASVLVGPGGFVASPAGVPVGVFAWGNPSSLQASVYYQASSFLGFVKRVMQAVITQYLGYSTQLIPGGDAVDLDAQGDFWALFASGGTAGQKVYANPVTGACTAAATGGSVSGAITSLSVATTGVMTVNTITGTPLAVGQVITAPGVPAGSYIASLGSGTGGAGTYNLANVDGAPFVVVTAQAGNYFGVQETPWYLMENVDAAASFTGVIAAPVTPNAGGIITISALTNTVKQGQFISGTGVPVNTQIGIQLTGSVGGTGTYQTNSTVAVSSTAMTAVAGQLGKISSQYGAGTAN